jgi:hypothetical protein
MSRIMRRPAARVIALGLAVFSVACGLSTSGLGPTGGNGDGSSPARVGSNEDSSPGTVDATPTPHDATTEETSVETDSGTLPDQNDGPAAAEVGGDVATENYVPVEASLLPDAPSDGGGCTSATAGCVIVPPGWNLVAFGSSASNPSCPTGFGPASILYESPSAAGACSCGSCNVTTPPTCAEGPIQVFYDTVGIGGGRCNLTGSVSPISNNPAGACLTDLYQGDYRNFDIEYVPSAASGAVCSSQGVAGGATFGAQDRACALSDPQMAGCTGNACLPPNLGSYQACVMRPGALTCPSGFGTRHLVGTGASFNCTACGCSVTGQCNGTVTLYSDMSCSSGAFPVPADGSCNRIANLGSKPASSFNSYIYTGGSPQNVTCMTSGSSSPQNLALTNEATVCCAP